MFSKISKGCVPGGLAFLLCFSSFRRCVETRAGASVCRWVLFNILGPLQNQLDAMGDKKKRSVAAGLGLGAASLLAAQNAEAAQQVADLAAGDNRFGTIAFLALPVVG